MRFVQIHVFPVNAVSERTKGAGIGNGGEEGGKGKEEVKLKKLDNGLFCCVCAAACNYHSHPKIQQTVMERDK